MKRKTLFTILAFSLPVMLACGLPGTVTDAVTGGESFKPAAQLWSDVPRMDGLEPSELEDLPLPVKLLMRTMIGNLGRMNAEGEDQTTGNSDWISYNRGGTPADVSAFYTPELMAGNGWEIDGGSACAEGSATVLPRPETSIPHGIKPLHCSIMGHTISMSRCIEPNRLAARVKSKRTSQKEPTP